jgi:hypothetical protein
VLKFKNVGPDKVDVFKPAELGGAQVDAGGVLEVDGSVFKETDDAYIVGEGGAARAWPKSRWELVKDTSAAKTVKADKEN